jgi:hypothetical protein
MWETDEEMVAELNEEGCIESISYDEDGEQLIKFNMDLLEIKYPAVADAVREYQMEEVDEALARLMEQGLLEMSFSEQDDGSLEPVYMLSEFGRKVVESNIFQEMFPEGLTDQQ